MLLSTACSLSRRRVEHHAYLQVLDGQLVRVRAGSALAMRRYRRHLTLNNATIAMAGCCYRWRLDIDVPHSMGNRTRGTPRVTARINFAFGGASFLVTSTIRYDRGPAGV
jgi:hypothetical protein